jgi:hypothetical protein
MSVYNTTIGVNAIPRRATAARYLAAFNQGKGNTTNTDGRMGKALGGGLDWQSSRDPQQLMFGVVIAENYLGEENKREAPASADVCGEGDGWSVTSCFDTGLKEPSEQNSIKVTVVSRHPVDGTE